MLYIYTALLTLNFGSKEALTTEVMQRYWVISHIKRVLGNKIRGFNEAIATQG